MRNYIVLIAFVGVFAACTSKVKDTQFASPLNLSRP